MSESAEGFGKAEHFKCIDEVKSKYKVKATVAELAQK